MGLKADEFMKVKIFKNFLVLQLDLKATHNIFREPGILKRLRDLTGGFYLKKEEHLLLGYICVFMLFFTLL